MYLHMCLNYELNGKQSGEKLTKNWYNYSDLNFLSFIVSLHIIQHSFSNVQLSPDSASDFIHKVKLCH